MTTDTTSTDLEVVPDRTLFQTNDPVEVLAAATRVAGAFKQALVDGKMVQKIRLNDHIKVEGWQTIGAMLGVIPVCTSTEPLPDQHGWKARVEARTLDGRLVGAAEAICSRDEEHWARREDFQLFSMAQTRATSKALKGPLSWVVKLAGYETTPAEEISNAEAGDFGPDCTPKELNRAGEALAAIYGQDTDTNAGGVLRDIIEHLGYMPKACALALFYAAKHRPGADTDDTDNANGATREGQ